MNVYLTAAIRGTFRILPPEAPLLKDQRVEVKALQGTLHAYERVGFWPSESDLLRHYGHPTLPPLNRADFTTVGEAVAAIEAHLQLTGGS